MCLGWAVSHQGQPGFFFVASFSFFPVGEGSGEGKLLPYSPAFQLGFDLGKGKPLPPFEAAASTTCLFSPSRKHFCSECCLLLVPSASASVPLLIGKKVHQWGDGVWNS